MTDAPAKPTAANMNVQVITPDDEKRRLADLCEALPPGEGETRAKPKPGTKPPGKLGAKKLTPEEQKRRFIDAAREAGASEDEADFDAALLKIAKPKQGQA